MGAAGSQRDARRAATARPAAFRQTQGASVDRRRSSRPARDGADLRTIVVVDERRLILEALTVLLGSSNRFAVWPAVTDPAAIVSVAPDLVLVAAGAASAQPLWLIESLHQLAPGIRTVVITESLNPELISHVLRLDIDGIVLTDSTADDLTLVLEQVLRGHAVLPVGWRAMLADSRNDPLAALSKRQQEVLHLLRDGCTYEEISSRLIITRNTVKFHVRSIYLQLGVHNRMAAARLIDTRRLRQVNPDRSTTRAEANPS